jgi:ribosomal protein S18 acetylase RimI-like enzyme
VIELVPFQPADLPHVAAFVAALQEHERATVPDLKPGHAIAAEYTELLVRCTAERGGILLVAKSEKELIGFACAWIETDDDPLLQEEARNHAYISDVFVADAWRRRRVATELLQAIETEMGRRGCRRIRVHAKAANHAAVDCYRAAGYRGYEVVFSKPLT